MAKHITKIALRGVALAMGVAVIVASTLKSLEVANGVAMLGIGLAALALVSLQEEG